MYQVLPQLTRGLLAHTHLVGPTLHSIVLSAAVAQRLAIARRPPLVRQAFPPVPTPPPTQPPLLPLPTMPSPPRLGCPRAAILRSLMMTMMLVSTRGRGAQGRTWATGGCSHAQALCCALCCCSGAMAKLGSCSGCLRTHCLSSSTTSPLEVDTSTFSCTTASYRTAVSPLRGVGRSLCCCTDV